MGEVVFIDIAPGEIQNYLRIIEAVLPTSPSAIILGAYDSGKLPDELHPIINVATAADIAMFGLRQTTLEQAVIDISVGEEPLLDSYYFDRRFLEAGLLPLQGYPKELTAIARKAYEVKKDCEGVYPIKYISVEINHEDQNVLHYTMEKLRRICARESLLSERKEHALTELNDPYFNKRIEDCLAGNPEREYNRAFFNESSTENEDLFMHVSHRDWKRRYGADQETQIAELQERYKKTKRE